jgi:hypothetical protein
MNNGGVQARADMKSAMAEAQLISNEILNIPNNHNNNSQP